jgi:uncharacterized protein YndB with AHSA1/START domain
MMAGKHAMETSIKLYAGKWFIVEMERWDQEYVNIEVPAHFTFRKDGTGHFQFGLVQGEMDCRLASVDREARIEFSWEGQDEMDPVNGRGWALLQEDQLRGRIFIHQGDDSAFRAQRLK